MDLADIPAAAAFLGAELPSASAESASAASRNASASGAASSRLHDLSGHSGAKPMDPHSTAAATAALLGAAHFYPGAAAAAAAAASAAACVGESNMAQHYYAQNLASFASGFMPMYGMGMFGGPGAPPPFLHQGLVPHPPPPQQQLPHLLQQHLRPPPPMPPQTQPLLNVYDMDATALQNQMSAQFARRPPEQQPVYYEGIRQQLHAAAEGLNDDQKQALLHMDPSLSFSMQPLEQLDSNANLEDSAPTSSMTTPARAGGVKRPRSASNAAEGGTKKKSKKSKAASSAVPPAADGSGVDGDSALLNEESPGGSSSAVTTPRATPRGRPPGSSSARAAAAAAGIQLTASGKKKSMTPQAEEMRARKAKMTWPKGTFLIRLQDVKVRNGRDHIWLVDNHQLLQRYNNESGSVRADGSRVYHKTDRYTGWLCHEGHHYFPLFEDKHVLRQDGDTVTVLFPDEDDLQQAIEYGEQEKARLEALKDANEPNSRPLPPSIRDQPARHALLLQQQQQQQQLELQESQTHSTQSGTSLTSSSFAMRSSSQMKMEEEGGGERTMRRRNHPVTSISSCSMLAGAADFPSTSRGMVKREMPSLPRQIYWNEEEEADEGMLLLDEDIMDDREMKKEEEEYEDLLDDVMYSRSRRH